MIEFIVTVRRFKKLYYTDYPILITTNVKDRIGLFDDSGIANILAAVLLETEKLYKFHLISYVIMPDHMHILLMTNAQDISKIMKSFKSFVAFKLRNELDIDDKFWQKSFDFRIKDTEESFEIASTYVRRNPIKADLPRKYLKLPYFYISKENYNRAKAFFVL